MNITWIQQYLYFKYTKIKIYLIERMDDVWYDEYAWVVVIAKTEESAIKLSVLTMYWLENLKTTCIWTANRWQKEWIVLEDFISW